MPALNFQARFADLVESGDKRQTIRALRKDGRDPKPGDTLYLYTGMRTKACRKLLEAECLMAVPILLERGPRIGSRMTLFDAPPEIEDETENEIAQRDGFRWPDDLYNFFQQAHGLPFKGLLIRW